jgi:hypothetical protein
MVCACSRQAAVQRRALRQLLGLGETRLQQAELELHVVQRAAEVVHQGRSEKIKHIDLARADQGVCRPAGAGTRVDRQRAAIVGQQDPGLDRRAGVRWLVVIHRISSAAAPGEVPFARLSLNHRGAVEFAGPVNVRRAGVAFPARALSL